MPSLTRLVSATVGGAALIAAAVLAAGPVSAAQQTWTISHGGAVTATTKSFKLSTSGFTMPCSGSTVKVKLKSGKGLPGANAGTVTSSKVTGCGVQGFTITIKAGHLPWHLNLQSYNSAKGVTTGTVTGIHLSVAVPAIGCTAVVDGTGASKNNGVVKVTYTNKTATLTTLKTGGKLHLYDVNSCLGFISNGDSVTITASYKVSPAQKITSP